MSSKRHSIVPPVSSSGPKPPVYLSSSLTIADLAVLTGTHHISIHGDSVVHPRARFHSLTGRVTVGRRCIIHERATIGASPHSSSSSSSSRPTSVTSPLGTPLSPSSAAAVPGGAGGGGGAEGHAPSTGVTLGEYVTVEVGATIEAGGTVIGEGTVVGVGARVGAGAVVGKVSQSAIQFCRGLEISTTPTIIPHNYYVNSVN
jgi:dynactin-6